MQTNIQNKAQYTTISLSNRCIAAMTRSSPICAEPYADMVRKRHIAEGTDFDAEHRAQEMWSLLYSLTRIMNGASQRLYRGDDLKNRELVQPNVEILHDAKRE